jgi:sterol desaturase/sphingolipid hydroxylase (fatty acid hydroxylase superfamily)
MRDVLIIWGSFFAVGALFTVWERLSPARPVRYRAELLRDFGAFATVFSYFLLVGMLIQFSLPDLVPPDLVETVEATGLLNLPVWARLVLFYLLWDFSLYWVHRLMHTAKLWPTHRWHHVPEQVWWFVGVRGSFPHIAMTYFPFLWFWILDLPTWLALVVSVDGVVRNAWMHVNVTGKWMRYAEWVFVTPRFHAIHHSDNPGHYRFNLGSMFTFWDHWFGTYVDPETVRTEELHFGIKEEVPAMRLAIGF